MAVRSTVSALLSRSMIPSFAFMGNLRRCGARSLRSIIYPAVLAVNRSAAGDPAGGLSLLTGNLPPSGFNLDAQLVRLLTRHHCADSLEEIALFLPDMPL